MNVNDALTIARVAMTFGQVERATTQPDGTPETDTTHTVMLALIAAEVAAEMDMDVGRTLAFAVVHDLPETYAGDTDTTGGLTVQEQAIKARAETMSLQRLTDELGPTSWTISMVRRYENQTEPEARLVRVIDKAVPKLTNVINGGMSPNVRDTDPADLKRGHVEQQAKLAREYPEFCGTPVGLLFSDACQAAQEVFAKRAAAEVPGWAVIVASPHPRSGRTEFKVYMDSDTKLEHPLGSAWRVRASAAAFAWAMHKEIR